MKSRACAPKPRCIAHSPPSASSGRGGVNRKLPLSSFQPSAAFNGRSAALALQRECRPREGAAGVQQRSGRPPAALRSPAGLAARRDAGRREQHATRRRAHQQAVSRRRAQAGRRSAASRNTKAASPARRITGRPRRGSTGETSRVLPSIRTGAHWPARGRSGLPLAASTKRGGTGSSGATSRQRQLHRQRAAQLDPAVEPRRRMAQRLHQRIELGGRARPGPRHRHGDTSTGKIWM